MEIGKAISFLITMRLISKRRTIHDEYIIAVENKMLYGLRFELIMRPLIIINYEIR